MPQVFSCQSLPVAGLLLALVFAMTTACSSTEAESTPPEVLTVEVAKVSSDRGTGTAPPSSTNSERFGSKYSELRAQGKSHKAATELAMIYTRGSADSGGRQAAESQHAMDAAILLARFSTTERQESSKREQAAEELKMRFQSRELDTNRALNLLNTITPEASINERSEAARNLARLSQSDDWAEDNTAEAANELVMLITGDALYANKRISAAAELARRSGEGGLDTESTLELVNRIAPELSLEKRREAVTDLKRLWNAEEWDDETMEQLAESGFQVLTGDELNVEQRQDAVVELAGESVKGIMGGEYEAGEVDAATEILKKGLRGELNEETISNFLNSD